MDSFQQYADQETPGYFVSVITDIKDTAAKQGITITDDDIANKLSIPFSDYGRYRSTDVAPFSVLKALTVHFKAFTKYGFQIVSFESEHEVPDPPDPDNPDDWEE